MRNSNSKRLHWLNNIRAVHRLLLCIGLAGICFFILAAVKFELLTSVMISWNTFSLCMIVISWITFITTPAKQLCLQAATQDESRSVIFIIIVISVCISLLGILILFQTSNESLIHKEVHYIVSMMGVGLSWFLLHTIFTLHYAHLYYTHSLKNSKIQQGGLDFPEEKEPDYLDVAYFSFVIGMTFQVSDVRITSRRIRRVVLLHGLISFVFNSIIVALIINTFAGLKK